MAQLILCDANGHEVGRKPMAPAERYALYELCSEHGLLTFEGKRYAVTSVAWCIPDEECRLCVRFDSWEPSSCDCD